MKRKENSLGLAAATRSVHGRGVRIVVTQGEDGLYHAEGFLDRGVVPLADTMRSAGTALFARLQIHRYAAAEPEETSLGAIIRNAVRVRRFDDGSHVAMYKGHQILGEDLPELALRLKAHGVRTEAYVVVTDERGQFLREAVLDALVTVTEVHHIASPPDASVVLHVTKVP